MGAKLCSGAGKERTDLSRGHDLTKMGTIKGSFVEAEDQQNDNFSGLLRRDLEKV